MNILGISLYGRGSSACIVRDGAVVAAAREEWFSRRADDAAAPLRAAESCIEQAGLEPDNIKLAVCAVPGHAAAWFPGLLRGSDDIIALKHAFRPLLGTRCRFQPIAYHESLMASALMTCPHADAAGFVSTTCANGPLTAIGKLNGHRLSIVCNDTSSWPVCALHNILGTFLRPDTSACEKAINEMAAQGGTRYVDYVRRKFIEQDENGIPRLRPSTASEDIRRDAEERFASLLSARTADDGEQRELDLARAVRMNVEEALLSAAKRVHAMSGASALALAGDYTLDGAAVNRLRRDGPFADIWVPPSPLDAAPGAALLAWTQATGGETKRSASCYVGPEYSCEALQSYLDEEKITYERHRVDDLIDKVAGALAHGAVVGWFQGAMAAGPWNMGARAVLADPRNPAMLPSLNGSLRRGAPFRTFCGVVQEERIDEYVRYDGSIPSTVPIWVPMHRNRLGGIKRSERKRGNIERLVASRCEFPAITGADGHAMMHVVRRNELPLLHGLLGKFRAQTGCGVLLCGDLRRGGEPIATTPRDAYACFMAAGLHFLALGPYLLDRRQQPLWNE